VTRGPDGQMALSPFAPGDVVAWHDERGRRVGRFVGVVAKGRHRGAAEVAMGGTLGPERVVRVPLGRLRRHS
jgi:hypothetical protein